MTASTEPSPVWSRTSTALRGLAALPLIQSGLSLVMSSVVASGLGFLFWLLAARQYDSADLGVGSAVITAMILLADVSHLGLRTGLVRFVPTAGRDTRALIARAYGLSMGTAGLGALVFVVGLGFWMSELAVLRSWGFGLLFVIATMCWVVFQLEDSVMLALRLAHWVPVENGVFGALKIALLFPLAGLAGRSAQLGVYLAWSLPVFVVVAVVTVAVVSALNRTEAAAQAADGPARPAGLRGLLTMQLSMRQVLSYSLVDWAATMSRSAVIGVLPMLVLATRGGSVAAYWSIAWTIAFSVYMLSANVGDALLAEASYDQDNVDRHTLHSGLLSMAISAPVVVVAIVATPWVLQAFGREYAEGASTVLRLLLLGSIPNVVTRTYVGRLRAEGRMSSVLIYEAVISVAVLVLGWALLYAMGIAGVALAWLVVLTAAAGYVLAVELVGWWGPRLGPRGAGRMRTLLRLVERIDRRRPRPSLDQAVHATLAARYATRPTWRRLDLSPHSQTVQVSGHEGRPPLRMELAITSWGAEVLGRRVAAIAALGDMTGLPSFRALVPFPIEHHTGTDPHFLIESGLSGTPGTEVVRVGAAGRTADDLLRAIHDPLTAVHQATAGWLTFGPDELDVWVSQPLRHLGEAAGLSPQDVVSLGRVLCDGLAGQRVPSARIHGNLGLGRALFDPSGRLTGLVDWEWSAQGPAFLDWCSLALSAVAVHSDQDIGGAAREMLEDPEVFRTHSGLARQALPEIDSRVLVLFTWLHTVVPLLRSAPEHGWGRYWMIRNVEQVLDHHRRHLAVAAR